MRGAVCKTRRAVTVSVFAKISFLIENRSTKVSLIFVGGVAEVSPALVGGVVEASPLVGGVGEVSPALVGGTTEINRFCVVRVRKVYWVEEGASREIVFKA